jgi:hypothetical protein
MEAVAEKCEVPEEETRETLVKQSGCNEWGFPRLLSFVFFQPRK